VLGEVSGAGLGHVRWGRAAVDKRLSGKVGSWKVHDLRRTCATRLADLGVQPHVVECILNHYGGFRAGTSGTYNRSPYLNEMRAALALWADHLESIGSGDARKVVAFPQPAR